MRRKSNKAPTKRTVAVSVITVFIAHLLDARLRLSPVAENTKFHTEQPGRSEDRADAPFYRAVSV